MTNIPYKSRFPEKSDPKTVTAMQALVKLCAEALAEIQKGLRFDTLRLSAKDRTRLAEVLVDFILDLKCGSGIWSALERYNTKFFDTPLPLIYPMETELPPGREFLPPRVHFLLWNIYPQIEPGLWLSPRHVDLLTLAESVAEWFRRHWQKFPEVSPVKEFMARPNDFGWEVKRKLIWLGRDSYLFRMLFARYFDERYEGGHEVAVTDDFLCQETTLWSGLGVIDILAECLEIPEEQKDELRNWYERHASIYKIAKMDDEISEAVNLVTDTTYRIREGSPDHPRPKYIKPGMTVYGSLVPWRGEWYWSGEQHDLTPYSKEQIVQAVAQHKQNTQIVARFWPQREEQAREFHLTQFQNMMQHYGGDLTVLPSGQAWHREEKKRLAAYMKSLGAKQKPPQFPLPENLRSCNGVGIYLDPVEGMEIMGHFHTILAGLKKNGKTITPSEAEMIRDWLEAPAISPGFIHRALREYGGEDSIKHAVRWDIDAPYWLDYLLRCRKGEYYRRRFPNISIVGGE